MTISVVNVLRERAQELPDKQSYTFLSGSKEAGSLTFSELERRSRTIASLLPERKV